jgi:hypothetical protein
MDANEGKQMRIRPTSLRRFLLLLGGLAQLSLAVEHLAVSADGTFIISGGASRVLYQHDATTLRVVKRIRVNQPIRDLAVNRDGNLMFIADGVFDPTITVRKTATGEVVRTIPKVQVLGGFGSRSGIFAFAQPADRLVYSQDGHFHVISMLDARELIGIAHPDPAPFLVTLNPDGTVLAVMTRGVPNDEAVQTPPADLQKGPDLTEFTEKHDGKGSILTLYDVGSGKQTARVPLWFSADGYQNAVCGFTGDDLVVLTYGNVNVRITEDGAVTLFPMVNYGYGMGISPDGRLVASGSMIKTGLIRDLQKGAEIEVNGVDPVPGWPEYYARLTFDGLGRLYGLTSSLRIFRVNKDNQIGPIEPVY